MKNLCWKVLRHPERIAHLPAVGLAAPELIRASAKCTFSQVVLIPLGCGLAWLRRLSPVGPEGQGASLPPAAEHSTQRGLGRGRPPWGRASGRTRVSLAGALRAGTAGAAFRVPVPDTPLGKGRDAWPHLPPMPLKGIFPCRGFGPEEWTLRQSVTRDPFWISLKLTCSPDTSAAVTGSPGQSEPFSGPASV